MIPLSRMPGLILRRLGITSDPALRRFTANSAAYKKYDIGDYTYGEPTVYRWLDGSHTLTVGRFCSIAPGVTIFVDGEHRWQQASTFPFDQFPPYVDELPTVCMSKGSVTIGNDVWLGFGATILSGVTIGNGAIVAAGAVVNKNVEAYSMVGGVPAKLLRFRFAPEVCEGLEMIRWWDWPINDVMNARKDLNTLTGQDFIRKYAHRMQSK